MSARTGKAATTEAAEAAEAKAGWKLYKKLMAEKEPAIPRELVDVIERAMNGAGADAVHRRAALAYLSTPFKKTADAIRADRKTALSFAAAYVSIRASLEKYKSLVDFMQAAEARLMVALAQREDMQEIIALAEADPDRTIQ